MTADLKSASVSITSGGPKDSLSLAGLAKIDFPEIALADVFKTERQRRVRQLICFLVLAEGRE
jgi:hypothetical protein